MALQLQATTKAYTNFDLLVAIYDSELTAKFDLKLSSFGVLQGLARYYNPKKPDVYPSIETLANKLNASEKTIRNAISELISKGLILKIKKGSNNHYYFTNLFWECISEPADRSNKITGKFYQNTGKKGKKTEENFTAKQNNSNKINNSDFFEKKKKGSGYQNKYTPVQEAPNYPSANNVIQQRKKDKETACSPLDFDKEGQIKYYNDLPVFARKNSLFCQEIKKRWNLDENFCYDSEGLNSQEIIKCN